MTTVNITTNKNTVTIDENNSSVIEVSTQGPQGAIGPSGPSGGIDISDSGKVDKSVIYYDSSSGQYKADATWTTTTLVFGGSF